MTKHKVLFETKSTSFRPFVYLFFASIIPMNLIIWMKDVEFELFLMSVLAVNIGMISGGVMALFIERKPFKIYEGFILVPVTKMGVMDSMWNLPKNPKVPFSNIDRFCIVGPNLYVELKDTRRYAVILGASNKKVMEAVPKMEQILAGKIPIIKEK